ncbi:hypothetical protein AMTRI_Chr05g72540 [Amborella trichopoda]|uniref:uncharacterized protein LOC18433034 n=1 Tax=Amborella trichopoda TaxID=13333 RepID=UPI0005D416B1|nr:uncharacterized protein LOC18433034 [Amborella trichopoda]|eukprot:XP_011622910.1 uncharacterized protein LOC18433034 [Amborella trichopoda]
MKAEGLCYAAGAALAHSCIDLSRKWAANNFNPIELLALVALLDSVLLCALASSSWPSLPPLLSNPDRHFLRILVLSSGLKVMAGYMYQKSLQISPISVTVPYLAFTPVMLLLTGFLLMGEVPSHAGMVGVGVVTIGGYLLALEKHGEPSDSKRARGEGLPELMSNGDVTSSLNKKVFSRFASSPLFQPFLALRKEEGSLLMLGVAGLLSISNSLDKMGAHLSESAVLFAAIQRVIMALPVMIHLLLYSPKSFKHLVNDFPAFALISVFEVAAFICFLKSLESLLVSYAVAAKRSNVILSVIVGKVVFKEKIWRKLPYIVMMVSGMALIILA